MFSSARRLGRQERTHVCVEGGLGGVEARVVESRRADERQEPLERAATRRQELRLVDREQRRVRRDVREPAVPPDRLAQRERRRRVRAITSRGRQRQREPHDPRQPVVPAVSVRRRGALPDELDAGWGGDLGGLLRLGLLLAQAAATVRFEPRPERVGRRAARHGAQRDARRRRRDVRQTRRAEARPQRAAERALRRQQHGESVGVLR
mmetsp:Transcript_20471/g.81884  ORF Transcript_20471/g.81884 Transcript_20471/m.81884 type:complete len:208 (-) Transcript_20471:143-766(-)